MKEGWKEVELGDIAPYWTEKIDASELNENNYISADNMEVDRGGISKSVYTPNEGRVTLFENNDILVSNIRPYFKKIWQAKYRGGCSNDVFVLRANNNITDARFLYFYLSKEDFFDFMMAGANGTKMPRGNKKSIPNYKINLPPLPTQRKIASILSAYDDLIENNLKRIKLLEEKAQLTYEEWFVRMKFPGHETALFDEESGLPEGWEKVKLGDIIENFDSKRKPLSKMVREKIPGKYPYYGAASIMDYIDKYNFEGRYVLMGEDGTVITKNGTPMLQFVDCKFWVNNHAHVLVGKIITNELLYLFLNQYQISGHITGVAQPKINQQQLNRIAFNLPPNKLMKEFSNITKPIFDSWFILQNQNQLLKEARDILLPRLMSGMVDVEEIITENINKVEDSQQRINLSVNQ